MSATQTLIKFGDTSPFPDDRSAEKRLVQRFAKPFPATTFLAVALSLASVPAFALLVEQFPNPTTDAAKPAAKETPYQLKLREGMMALLDGKLDAAEVALNAAAKLDAKAYAPLLGLAELAVRRGRFAEAEKFAAQAVTVPPISAQR